MIDKCDLIGSSNVWIFLISYLYGCCICTRLQYLLVEKYRDHQLADFHFKIVGIANVEGILTINKQAYYYLFVFAMHGSLNITSNLSCQKDNENLTSIVNDTTSSVTFI